VNCPHCKRPGRRNGSHDTQAGRRDKWFCKACWRSFSGEYRDIKPTRLGFFDIEASGLVADFSHMISWVIKREGKSPQYDCIKSLKESEEKRILKSLLKTFGDFDHLVGYYSSRFDFPYVRTRCLYHGLEFPTYGQLWTTDLYFSVRGRLSLSRKRLGTVSQFLETGAKQEVAGPVWASASFGDTKAFKQILQHNIQDVVILEKVWEKMTPFMKPVRRSI
jgi:uncharacterized protein YprB with RNaseH-like and TPR domain